MTIGQFFIKYKCDSKERKLLQNMLQAIRINQVVDDIDELKLCVKKNN
jgi:hypothetical protein